MSSKSKSGGLRHGFEREIPSSSKMDVKPNNGTEEKSPRTLAVDAEKQRRTFAVLEEARSSITGSPADLLTGQARDLTRDLVGEMKDPMKHRSFKGMGSFCDSDGKPSLIAVANSRLLSSMVFGSVFLNGLQMGIQTDLEGQYKDLDNMFFVLDNIFTAVFAIEFTIKITAYKKAYFLDRWNLFDCTLTWISIIDMWILGALGGKSGMKVLAVLRIFRIFRAVRLLRMLRQFRELTLIIEGLINALGTTTWVSMLLVLVLYIFSIFCVRAVGSEQSPYPGWDNNADAFEDAEEFNSYQYFGTIFRAMFTLLNVAMLTDDWFVVSRALLEKQPLILVAFLIFVFFTTFGLMNVIVGIIVENVMESARSLHDDEEQIKMRGLLNRLEMLYQFVFTLDKDGDEMLDAQELKNAWGTPEMNELLAMAELPAGVDANELLQLIDDNGDASLSMEEIVKGFVRLLTSDQNQRLLEIKAQQNSVKREIKDVKRDVAELKSQFNALPGMIHDSIVEALSSGRLHVESPIGERRNVPHASAISVLGKDANGELEAKQRLEYFREQSGPASRMNGEPANPGQSVL